MIILILFSSLTGKVIGKVFDENGKTPFVGVNVIVENTFIGSATDEIGLNTLRLG